MAANGIVLIPPMDLHGASTSFYVLHGLSWDKPARAQQYESKICGVSENSSVNHNRKQCQEHPNGCKVYIGKPFPQHLGYGGNISKKCCFLRLDTFGYVWTRFGYILDTFGCFLVHVWIRFYLGYVWIFLDTSSQTFQKALANLSRLVAV